MIYEIGAKGYSSMLAKSYDSLKNRLKNQHYKKALREEFRAYEGMTEGVLATDVTFYDINREQVKLSDFKGKVIVIDLWATWCGPCIKEKPYWDALENKYKNNPNFAFLSVSIDRFNTWKNYIEKEENIGIQLQTNSEALKAYKVDQIPRFFVIDKDFTINNVFAPNPSSGDLEKLLGDL